MHKQLIFGIGAAKIDESSGIIQGRYSGGVALMWKANISQYINQLEIDSDWCVAVEVCMGSVKLVIVNIYMPYQCYNNEDQYLENLGYITSLIEELNCTSFVIIGDFNANLGVSGSNLFADHMRDFCRENDLLISSKMLLPYDSYSYVSYRDSVPQYSWLDHIVSSSDFHNSIRNIHMLYDLTDEDHIPVTIHVNFELLPSLTNENNGSNFKINWNAATEIDLKKFLKLTDENFFKIEFLVEALCCTNFNCIDQSHINMINNFYNNIISILNESSTHISSKFKSSWNKPGWSEYVADLYDYFRETSKLWIEIGRPRQGFLFREYLKSKARYKYALRYIKRNENLLRKESLAKK